MKISISNPYVFALIVSGTDIYAGTDGDGVFRSTNNGVSWMSSSSGMTNLRILNLAASGTDLFSGTFGSGGIYRSSDNGSNWSAANNGLTNYDVWNITASGSNLFAGTGAGIFVSTNNGTDWNSASSGLSDTYVHTIIISGQYTFAGTDIEGVFRSTNNGASWTAINAGLIKPSIWALEVSGSYLFAGSNGYGIYKRPLSELVGVNELYRELPAQFNLCQNYPNPFNPVTEIEFHIPKSEFVSLKVFDITGKEIAKLVNENLTPGTYKINFNGDVYTSGVYFYTLNINGFSETRKMLLLK